MSIREGATFVHTHREGERRNSELQWDVIRTDCSRHRKLMKPWMHLMSADEYYFFEDEFNGRRLVAVASIYVYNV